MPISQPFADSLRGAVVKISLQTGWKWQRKSESGAWSPFDPPYGDLTVKDIELAQRSGPVLGFTGKVESGGSEFHGLSLLALTHTSETVGAEDVMPLALALSPRAPEYPADANKMLGYSMVPQGMPAYLGFGILVPPSLDGEG